MSEQPFYIENLSDYPDLEAFIQSDPADLSLISENRARQYRCHSSMGPSYTLSLAQVLAIYGKVSHLEQLNLSLADITNAIKENDFIAVQWVAGNGHLDVLRYFFSRLSKERRFFKKRFIREAIKAKKYYAHRWAAKGGHLAVIHYLEMFMNTLDKKRAVFAETFCSLQWAAAGRHLGVIKQLEKHVSATEMKRAIKANGYYAFASAAEAGDLVTLKYFESRLTEAEKKEAIEALDYDAIRLASDNQHHHVVEYFLEYYPSARDYILSKNALCERHFRPFALRKLNELRKSQNSFLNKHPQDVFDASSQEETRLSYDLARYFLCQTTNHSLDEVEALRFLLSLPSLRNIAHLAINNDGENELLRLAVRHHHSDAASILMTIPKVRELAAQHDYYRQETVDTLNLRTLAENEESSMQALSAAEQKQVGKLLAHYQQKMTEIGGVNAVLQHFKKSLRSRYEASPAVITIKRWRRKTQHLELPFDWSALQELRKKLTKKQYQAALKAYYQHDAHTAYRFLTIPNYWMSPKASYVNVYDINGKHTPYRYAAFEEFSQLIATFYLAASDELSKPTDGYSFEDRYQEFIQNIAAINRAHNWDKSRDVLKKGKRQHTKQGIIITEEYDDGKGDKPSCPGGIKKRILQSVLAHVLCKSLSDVIVLQALNEEVREYYKDILYSRNVSSLKQAYNALITYDESQMSMAEAQTKLKALNIPRAKKHWMINHIFSQLADCYGERTESLHKDFYPVLTRRFDSAQSIGCFISFDGACGLGKLLDEALKNNHTSAVSFERDRKTKVKSGRFFESPLRRANNLDKIGVEPVIITASP